MPFDTYEQAARAAFDHMVRQGKRAVSNDPGARGCCYKHPVSGLRCGVGGVLADDTLEAVIECGVNTGHGAQAILEGDIGCPDVVRLFRRDLAIAEATRADDVVWLWDHIQAVHDVEENWGRDGFVLPWDEFWHGVKPRDVR